MVSPDFGVPRFPIRHAARPQAGTVLVMGDGGNWIDPLSARECFYDQRIVDYYHAVEHLHQDRLMLAPGWGVVYI